MSRETPAAGSPEGWRQPGPNSEQCSVCGGFFLLRQDGTIRYHGAVKGVRHACRGSRKPPGHHVHRCACGACWDEEVYA